MVTVAKRSSFCIQEVLFMWCQEIFRKQTLYIHSGMGILSMFQEFHFLSKYRHFNSLMFAKLAWLPSPYLFIQQRTMWCSGMKDTESQCNHRHMTLMMYCLKDSNTLYSSNILQQISGTSSEGFCIDRTLKPLQVNFLAFN